jgi:hypothetical protein
MSVFRPVEKVECHMAASLEEVCANIEENLKLKLPEIEQLPEWKKDKGDEPFAIAGGGPSIHHTVETLRNFETILAAGSAHDWLREHGIRPRYCLILDPDPVSARYLKRPDPLCTYLVASCCHPSVFKALEGYAVTRWHSAGPEPKWFAEAWLRAGYAAVDDKSVIGGGPTCGLRAVTIGMVFGYHNLHFFGLDSNLDLNTEAHHAYDFAGEDEQLGDIIEFSLLPPPHGRVFRIAKYMLAQLWAFQDLINDYGKQFKITVHGDSALQEYWRMKLANARKEQSALRSES